MRISPDNEWVASGGDDNKLIVRNLKTGDIKHTFKHEDGLWMRAFSPDNEWVASGGDDNKLIVWNIKKLAKIKRSLSMMVWFLRAHFRQTMNGLHLVAGQ